MDDSERTEQVKKAYTALHIRSLQEYRRNLEGLKKAWENALKRHEARRPGLMFRVITGERAYREWSERRDTLFSNLTSCTQRIQELSMIIAAGGGSPEVGGYVEALFRNTPANTLAGMSTVERPAAPSERPM